MASFLSMVCLQDGIMCEGRTAEARGRRSTEIAEGNCEWQREGRTTGRGTRKQVFETFIFGVTPLGISTKIEQIHINI